MSGNKSNGKFLERYHELGSRMHKVQHALAEMGEGGLLLAELILDKVPLGIPKDITLINHAPWCKDRITWPVFINPTTSKRLLIWNRHHNLLLIVSEIVSEDSSHNDGPNRFKVEATIQDIDCCAPPISFRDRAVFAFQDSDRDDSFWYLCINDSPLICISGSTPEDIGINLGIKLLDYEGAIPDITESEIRSLQEYLKTHKDWENWGKNSKHWLEVNASSEKSFSWGEQRCCIYYKNNNLYLALQ